MSNNSVLYSLNGRSFSNYEVYVSRSTNLVGILEPKSAITYDWPEFDGLHVDTEAKQRFKPRYITLECFIRGENWQEMIDDFNDLFSEFDKSGTQRLVVDPMGYRTLVYDVLLNGQAELVKQFNKGVMFGTFTLNLLEPQPIKTVIEYTGISFTIKYNSDTQTSVNIDGSNRVFKGNVNETFTLSAGKHYIVVVGDFETLTSNGVKIWS